MALRERVRDRQTDRQRERERHFTKSLTFATSVGPTKCTYGYKT